MTEINKKIWLLKQYNSEKNVVWSHIYNIGTSKQENVQRTTVTIPWTILWNIIVFLEINPKLFYILLVLEIPNLTGLLPMQFLMKILNHSLDWCGTALLTTRPQVYLLITFIAHLDSTCCHIFGTLLVLKDSFSSDDCLFLSRLGKLLVIWEKK